MRVAFCDELPFAFGWYDPEDLLLRTGHALAVDGRVWLVDPFDAEGVEERVRGLGEPAGVVQLLDRHARDAAALARRLGVPHHVVPFGPAPAVPFQLLPLVDRRFWRESILWWPERRLLAAGDGLGTVGYFLAPGDALGVHPLLRLRPPRWLGELAPEHVVCGHGRGIHGPEAAASLRTALDTARRRLPATWIGALRHGRR